MTTNRTREQVVQTQLKEGSWTPVARILQREKIANIPFSSNMKVHCHIPVCAGYDGSIPSEELAALVDGIRAKGDNYDYTIYISPRDNQYEGETEDPLTVWKRENEELLKIVPPEKIVLERDYRATPKWKAAQKRYTDFCQTDRFKSIEGLLDNDVEKYFKRHQNVAREAIKKHMIDCAIDCLSWSEMLEYDIELSPNDADIDVASSRTAPIVELESLNVLFYTHELTQIMRNVLQNAGHIKYVLGSLIHVKPEFSATLTNEHKVNPNYTVEHATNLSECDKQVLQAVTETVVLQKADPLWASKLLHMMYMEMLKNKKDPGHVNETAATAVNSSANQAVTTSTSAVTPKPKQQRPRAQNDDSPLRRHTVFAGNPAADKASKAGTVNPAADKALNKAAATNGTHQPPVPIAFRT